MSAPAEELEASRQKKRRRKKHKEQEEATAASSEAPRLPTTPECKRESTVPVAPETLTSAAASGTSAVRLVKERERKNQVAPPESPLMEEPVRKEQRRKKRKNGEAAVVIPSSPTPAAAEASLPIPPPSAEAVPVSFLSPPCAMSAPAEELEAPRQKKRRRKKHREQEEATAASLEAPRLPTTPECKRESTVPVAPETLTSAAASGTSAVRLVKERERKNQVAPPASPLMEEPVRKEQRRKKRKNGEAAVVIPSSPTPAAAEASLPTPPPSAEAVPVSFLSPPLAMPAPAEELEASPRRPQTKRRVTISSLPPIAVSPPADTLEVAMTFWGVEVKPGEPYTHHPSPGHRFRITQALLGSYADVGWSILECNVGNMNPVRICALNPTNHICDLEIEYEERESVILSVSGSSSIHLLGRIYNHSASDDQAHTSNKLASKIETPACLKRKHQGNEANGSKEPSPKEPNVTKADGKNDASSKEPLISEAGGKNVASPKQPIVGEDDYSDDHLPICVAYEKRMATRKESSVVHTVPIQDHEITQDIINKADDKNDASPEEPIISEASGKNAASAKQPVVGEDDDNDDHLPVLVAHKKRMATTKRKYKSQGMGKILSDNNNDHKTMDSKVMHIMPTQDHEVTQDNISQFVGATGQSTRNDGFLFTGATNQHNWASVEEFYKGDGKSTASNGSKVTVEYVGKLLDGQIVDPMAIRKFKLGAGEVIPGWDAGISGMRVGSKRKVTIPPALGHGNRAVGMIPANSWLVYEFELKKVRRTKKASQVSKKPS